MTTKYLTRASCVLSLVTLLFGTCTNAAELNTILMESTFLVTGPSAKEPGKTSYGTMFLMGKAPVAEPKRYRHVMVTADHVLANIAGDAATILLRKRTGAGDFTPFQHKIQIRENGVPLWFKPEGVDVGVMYVDIPAHAYVSMLSRDFLATDETLQKYEMHPGDELLSLGFPLFVASNEMGFPILRSGKIASYPIVPTQKHRAFLYDFQVYPGNSGGPVYYSTTLRYYNKSNRFGGINFVAGLVSMQKTSKGENIPIYVAVVVPAPLIRDAIDALPEPK